MNKVSIDWLIDPKLEDSIIDHDTDTPQIVTQQNALKPGVSWSSESAKIDEGMYIFSTQITFEKNFSERVVNIGRFSSKLNNLAFMVRSADSGRSFQYEKIPERVVTCEPGVDMFRYADEFDFVAACESSTNLANTSLCIYTEHLNELLGVQSTERLIKTLELGSPPHVCSRDIPQDISAPLRRVFKTPYTGKLRLLAAQGRVLDYLCKLSSHLTEAPYEPELTESYSIIDQVRSELLKLEGKLPPLSELAKKYNTSAKVLNDQFKKNYGLSMMAFMADHRLRAAHEALKKSNIAIKVLAARLGYSHVNHFTTAFTKKFGYSPGKLRKNGAADHCQPD
jgi:AraC-like DNA-binding protein